uniref:Uncharacterized protein n=1 Tax=Panagrolaimus sp. PS1159 TaxID=55785 RepID=A0AC35FN32_9BILA
MDISHFQDPTRQIPSVDELYFQVKNHLKQEPIKTMLIIQDLNNCAVRFYNFIKNTAEIKYFDASVFQILIKFAFMQHNEREFVAAQFKNGEFWQKFQALAKFPSKQNELDFFKDLCKFFFIFIYKYQVQLINTVGTNQPTLSSFIKAFPYDFSQNSSLIDFATIPPSTSSNFFGTFQNNVSTITESPHLQPLQLDTLSPQSLTLLLEAALKTFCNTNSGNLNTSATTNSSQPLSFTQSNVAVNQVSPAPSDPIPPVQGVPPTDNNALKNNNLITSASTSATETQGIFSYPAFNAIPGISGINQPFGFGNHINQLNHLINQNRIFGEPQVTQTSFEFSGQSTVRPLSLTDVVHDFVTSSASINTVNSEDRNDAVCLTIEDSDSPSIPYLFNSEEADTLESSQPFETERQSQEIYENNIGHISQDLNEFQPLLQQEKIHGSHLVDNSNEDDEIVHSKSSSQKKLNETMDEKSPPSISKKCEEHGFIESEGCETKAECRVPPEASNGSTEVQKLAPLKIKLKLLQSLPIESKPLKRKRHHKSRRASKKDDNNESDNEYKSRIKIEDFNTFDTCYTDPLALRKIQRKTSAQIKQEQENFIERIYNLPDDEKKLKVIYPNVQAKIFFNHGDYITKFIGDIITSRSVYNEKKDNPFLIEIGRNKWIDGKDRRSFGVYILPAEIPQRANTTIKLHTTKNNITLKEILMEASCEEKCS